MVCSICKGSGKQYDYNHWTFSPCWKCHPEEASQARKALDELKHSKEFRQVYVDWVKKIDETIPDDAVNATADKYLRFLHYLSTKPFNEINQILDEVLANESD